MTNWKTVLTVTGGLALVVTLGLFILDGDDDPAPGDAVDTTTTRQESTASTSEAGPNTTSAQSTTTTSISVTTTTTGATTTTTEAATTPPPTSSPTTTASQDTTPPNFVGVGVSEFSIWGESLIGTPCPERSEIRYGVQDDVGVVSVIGTYDQGLPGSPLSFVLEGDVWEADFGPFFDLPDSFEEDVMITVTASDAAGNTDSVPLIIKVSGGVC